MARITHVKKAQQRYETVPVLDPETGEPRKVQVFRKDGSPKTTKRGREVFRALTVADTTKPLPPRKCGKCSKEITVGTPYKWIAPKSGPYGGRKLFRCADCPSWNVWDYSSSLSARIAQIQHDASNIVSGDWESESDATSAAEEIGAMIRELADEKEEAANNIVDGFGHETYQSEEIQGQAEELGSWADEVEGVDFPDFPEVEDEVECEQCGGDGKIEAEPKFYVLNEYDQNTNEEGYASEAEANANIPAGSVGWYVEESEGEDDCQECEGTGSVANDQTEPDEEALDAWREEAQQALQDAVDSCPL